MSSVGPKGSEGWAEILPGQGRNVGEKEMAGSMEVPGSGVDKKVEDLTKKSDATRAREELAGHKGMAAAEEPVTASFMKPVEKKAAEPATATSTSTIDKDLKNQKYLDREFMKFKGLLDKKDDMQSLGDSLLDLYWGCPERKVDFNIYLNKLSKVELMFLMSNLREMLSTHNASAIIPGISKKISDVFMTK